MKTNYIKCSVWLLAILMTAVTAKAQTTTSGETAYDNTRYNSYDRIHNEQGKKVEEIQTNFNDNDYKVKFVNDKMTELYVDGMKIPAADWEKHLAAIAEIREQMKKNRIQATLNEKQALLNQVQAKKNENQASLNEIQEVKNQQQAVRNQKQAQLNEIQARKNQEQEVRNEEQARLNEIQAKKNQVQAEENERFMKQIKADLIADKIIANENDLHQLTFNSNGLLINGVKQPDSVFTKYKEKYSRFSKGSFSYRNF